MRRGTREQRGYDYQWRKLRLMVLSAEPYCKSCQQNGIVRAATDIDHIIPHKGNESLRLNRSNLQPLCKECHGKKSADEGRQ